MADSVAQPPLAEATLLLIGPIYIGPLLAWMLFGVSIVQLYIYHTSFSRDPLSIQIAVYGIFFLDVFQSVVVAAVGWQVLVAGWGRPVNIEFPGWSFAATPFLSGVISASVQLFYAWRIYRLGKWRIIPAAIGLTGLASALGAIIFAIMFMFKKDLNSFHEPAMYSLCILWLGVGAFTDVVIMLSMFFLLYSAKRQSFTFQRSEFIVNRLMRLTVETGLACAITASLELAFFLGLPATGLHLAFATILSKVYSNTFMTSLNSRVLSQQTQAKVSNSVSLSSISRPGAMSNHLGTVEAGQPPLTIHITHEVDKSQDWDRDSNEAPGRSLAKR
ncbi:hypothetical protein GSI_10345 [Ganoderma sinense ZZ0214-1]|uniref:DUF6534 domain-containing protein n=1 Tax=Ganoderma sinense ZZ0214-1 TaxID=1077348 RepID=A0A2G8S0B4_9APHY|nr:hypothetical protein GSI_10345 [Ganoderma sinense ZZ0214-1]